MTLDCLLVHPAATRAIYGALGAELTAIEPPLWPRLIGAYLRDRGFEVAIADMEGSRLTARSVAERVAADPPRFVAICAHGHQPSASTQQMVGARAVAMALREVGYRGKVVLTGDHPSALPERTLREEPVDYVVDGEGPATLEGLLLNVPMENIPGLVWHRSDDIVQNTRAELRDPDRDLHGRAWDLLPSLTAYRAHNWQCLGGWPRSPYAAVYTSLSCPFACDFCMIQTMFHSHQHRRRSPVAVVEEMHRLYHDHGVRTFKIVDELFVLNRAHYLAICEGLADIGGDINVWAYARTDTVTPADLPAMRRAGIRWLALGIESGASAVRDAARKNLRHDEDNRRIVNTVSAIQDAGISVIGNYIFGLPNDTFDTMRQTLDLAHLLRTEWANFYSAMPYPGSALYERVARERPEDLPPSWAAYSQHARETVPLRNGALSARDILEFRDRAHREYFTHAGYRAALAAKFGEGALSEVDAMLAHDLPRDLLA